MLTRYYKKSILTTSVITLGCNLVYFFIYDAFSHYKREWLTTGSFFPIMFLMALVNSVIIGLLSLTIFLNRYPAIRNIPALSALAWFLLPMAWIGAILLKSKSELFNFSYGVDSQGIFVMLNTIPYIAGSIWAFIQFRRKAKRRLLYPECWMQMNGSLFKNLLIFSPSLLAPAADQISPGMILSCH